MHARKRTATTAGTALLSVAEARQHARVDDTGSETTTEIEQLIDAAIARIERETELSLLTQTWVLKLDGFWSGWLRLPYPPLASVSSITYLDADGVSQTLSSSIYTVDVYSVPGRVYLTSGQTWPVTQAVPGAVTVTFTAGFGATGASVPASLKHATKLLCGHYLKNKEAVLTGTIAVPLPEGVADLLRGEWVPESA